MSISATIGGVLKATAGEIMQGLDGLFTSDDERNSAAVLIQQAMNDANSRVMEHVEAEDRERTKRHEADMQSDSWLSKNVRPITLVFLTAMLTLFMGLDAGAPKCVILPDGTMPAWCFSVSETWIQLYSGLLMLVYGFYFGSRGLEKIAKMFTSKTPGVR